MNVFLKNGAKMPTKANKEDAIFDIYSRENKVIKAHESASVLLSEGVIDRKDKGSILINLYNNGNNDYHVKEGEKIGQLVFLPCIPTVLPVSPTVQSDNATGNTGRCVSKKHSVLSLVEEGLKIDEIASKLGLSDSYVARIIIESGRSTKGMRKKSIPKSKLLEKEIVDLYNSGKQVKEIKNLVGLSKPTVYNVIKNSGIERRSLKNKIIAALKSGIAPMQVAKQLNVSKQYVYSIRSMDNL